jgi:serine phosphatase RsbU (regulator of sigma subunit)
VPATFKSATETVRLKPGDVLLLYTDGVTEAHNSQRDEFGLDRLVEIVQQQASGSAEELLHAVRLELGRFLNGQAPEDDTTLVAIKLNQPGAR